MQKPFFWGLLENYGILAIKLVFSVLIARILNPYDYGLIAYTGIFIFLANTLSGGGFTQALIYKKSCTESDFSTVFYFNFLLSIGFILLFLFFASNFADLFDEPKLEPVIKVQSLAILFTAISQVQNVKLLKQLDFKKLTIINSTATFLASTLALVSAFLGAGYWALVIQELSGSGFRMVGLFYTERWLPKAKLSWVILKEHLSYGLYVMLGSIMNNLMSQLYYLIIGKRYNTVELGFFFRAKSLFDMSIVQTGSSIGKVLFPYISDLKFEYEERIRRLENFFIGLFIIFSFISYFLYVYFGYFVLWILTEKWLPIVPVFKVLLVAAPLYPLIVISNTILLHAGRPKAILFLQVTHQLLLLGLIFFTLDKSITIIATGIVIAYFYLLLILILHLQRKMIFSFGFITKHLHLLWVMLILFVSAMVLDISFFLIWHKLIITAITCFIAILILKKSAPCSYEMVVWTLTQILPEKKNSK